MDLHLIDGGAKGVRDIELEFATEIYEVASRYLPELEAEDSSWLSWAETVRSSSRTLLRDRQVR